VRGCYIANRAGERDRKRVQRGRFRGDFAKARLEDLADWRHQHVHDHLDCTRAAPAAHGARLKEIGEGRAWISYFDPITIDSAPTSGSTRVFENPTSRIQA